MMRRRRSAGEMLGLIKLLIGVIFVFGLGALGAWMGGRLGMVIGGMLSLVVAILALLVASQFMMVLYGFKDRRSAFRSLLTLIFGINYPFVIVHEGRIIERAKGNPFSRVGGPGLVIITPGNAVLFERFGRPTRVAGAGYVFTDRFEIIRDVLDLRLQAKSKQVEASTKDGIPLQITLNVFFKIDSGGGTAIPENPYPFSPRAVMKAVYERVMVDGKALRWDEIAIEVAASRLRDWITRHFLDDMYEPLDKESDALARLREELLQEVKQATTGYGVEVVGLSIGTIEVPEEIKEQRFEWWRADWQRAIDLANAHHEQKLARIRAKTRADAIRTIFKAIREQAGAEVTDAYVALRYIEALERMSEGQMTVLSSLDSAKDIIAKTEKEQVSEHFVEPKEQAQKVK